MEKERPRRNEENPDSDRQVRPPRRSVEDDDPDAGKGSPAEGERMSNAGREADGVNRRGSA